MENINPLYSTAEALLSEFVLMLRERYSAKKVEALDDLAVKLHGLVSAMVDISAPAGVIRTYEKAKFKIGDSKGRSVTITLKEMCSSIGSGFSPYSEEDAIKMIAFDVSQKVFEYLRRHYEGHPHKRAAFSLYKYILVEHLERLQKGNAAISDIFYFQKRVGPANINEDDEDEREYAIPSFGDSPGELLERGEKRRLLASLSKALSSAMGQLRKVCVESFNFLVALVESALIARADQSGRFASRVTETVLQDISPLFVESLLMAGGFTQEQYQKVFDSNYDPFSGLHCGGSSGAARVWRVRARKKMLVLFEPLLATALGAVLLTKVADSVLAAVCTWLKGIRA